VRVYEIIAPAGCPSVAEQQLCGLFAEGLAAYRARDWDQSERCFAQCLAVMPTDGPATVFHRRIKLLRGKTLPTDWNGVCQGVCLRSEPRDCRRKTRARAAG
jgi:adenylate cyclase